MTAELPITIRPLRLEEDEPAALELLRASLAGGPTGERTAAFFRWKHRANPFGCSPGLVAEADGRMIGLRVFLRWEFLRWELAARAQVVRAVRAVDTATHPDFQGRGIFRRLTLTALKDLAISTDLVFNTPNGNSLPGYLSLGWQPTGTIPVALRPVRWGAFLRGVRTARHAPPGGPARSASPLPPASAVFAEPGRLQRLLDTVVSPATAPVPAGLAPAGLAPAGLAGSVIPAAPRLRTRLSVPYLRWRYGDPPGLDYRVLIAERHGELAGVAFGRFRHRGGLTELTLAEVIVRPGDTEAARCLLRAAARAAARSGCHHVATHLAGGTDLARAGRFAGYVVPPRTGMLLVTRPLRHVEPDPRRRSSWRFSLGDLEVF